MKKRPKICIDARLNSGLSGGVEQFVIGLAQGMSSFTDGDEEYYFLTYLNADGWLLPYLHGSCTTLYTKRKFYSKWRRAITSKFPYFGSVIDKIDSMVAEASISSIPVSNGTIESAGIDLMHFTWQNAFLTKVPSIYQPHDLQHVHFPEYFSEINRKRREIIYSSFSKQARMVLASSSWVGKDFKDHLDIEQEKIGIVPLAPPTEAYAIPSPEYLVSVVRKFNLPGKFAFYPAQTWPHKNHLNLIHAVANLRDAFHLRIPLVFSGHRNDYYIVLKKKVDELGLSEQVQFLGFVTPKELQALYKLCHCVVIPSQFEAASFPLWEAFLAGVPAACSNITSLPKQAGDAALLFDPNNIHEISNCLSKLWSDDKLRKNLVERAKENVNRFSWKRTSLCFRAHYRRILGLELTKEDNDILNTEPII